jgi:excinuclease ABC subunit C
VGLPIVGLAKEREPEGRQGGPEAAADVSAAAEAAAVAPDAGAVAGEAGAMTPEAAAPRTPAGRGRGEKKGRDDGKRPDRIFLPQAKDAIPIRPDSAEMFVLQHLRDEAHRFAVTFHRSQRKRRTLRSALSDVTGIGATRQRALLRHFGSLKKIRESSLEALVAVPGMSRKAAEAVLAHFAAQPDPAVRPPGPAVEVAPGAPPALEEAAEPEDTAADAEEDALESAFAAVDDE